MGDTVGEGFLVNGCEWHFGGVVGTGRQVCFCVGI